MYPFDDIYSNVEGSLTRIAVMLKVKHVDVLY